MKSTHRKGQEGEARAVAWLEEKGCQILARNFRCRAGEVDIVGEEGGTILFVEVKAWRVFPEDALERALGPRKQGRITGAARVFLQKNPQFRDRSLRFDVICIDQGAGTVRHIQGAFEAACPE
ncbi:hypothetical protein AU468_06085 [Alkalispirochaeta sphaeroplastigenens]|uniref:UPF0102 protein AU468_06085 n=1 Tax=Alkalispirochaeta sphaeroplastigenens TaxID=1187066 RepID=A0A2S4JTH8_9SPIO|nr:MULTISPECIES: YraN family protein [Alkalispirochaeta]POR02821.1 hypothetical protein AU468_06085 [Alkalispirochaeta sphaeroplastigenens]